MACDLHEAAGTAICKTGLYRFTGIVIIICGVLLFVKGLIFFTKYVEDNKEEVPHAEDTFKTPADIQVKEY